MSTSLIYHAMGLQDYEYVHQKFAGGSVILRVKPRWRLLRCPACKSKRVVRRGQCLHKLRSVPIGRKPVWLMVEVPESTLPCLWLHPPHSSCDGTVQAQLHTGFCPVCS